jgi:hypothetical protein
MSGVNGQPNDNPDPIEPGNAVNFPNPSINPYGTIQRVSGSNSQFKLPPNGVYEIIFTVVVQNTGELVVVLNDSELLMTVIGKSGNGEIVGTSIISTPTGLPSVLSINNVSVGDNGGIKIDESTGPNSFPLTCHLIIKQLS